MTFGFRSNFPEGKCEVRSRLVHAGALPSVCVCVSVYVCVYTMMASVLWINKSCARCTQGILYSFPLFAHRYVRLLLLRLPLSLTSRTGVDDEAFLAFAIPWSVSENAASLTRAQRRFSRANQPFVFTREKLCSSLEGRPVEVLTITGGDGDQTSRPVFVVTSRVHPGETPASHMCNGIIDFLLRVRDERAHAARSAFVFKIVSLLNPDGVANGHYRCDTRGVNLNRCYEEPDSSLHPTVHAVKSLIVSNAPTFVIDLHAHANKKGCFAFGNAIPNTERRAESICFAKLAAMNCAYFDFSACNFSERNMVSKDKGGSTTKEGSARVALYRETGMTHIYTVEANYNSGRVQSGNFTIEADVLATCPLRSTSNENSGVGGTATDEGRCGAATASSSSFSGHASSAEYDESSFACMGRCLILAALDLIDANPLSTMRRWSLKSLSALRCWAQQHVRKIDMMSGSSGAPGFSFGKPPPLPDRCKGAVPC